MQTELLYLGHLISADGLRSDPAKVAAVRDWPIPTDLKGLRSFLGFANYLQIPCGVQWYGIAFDTPDKKGGSFFLDTGVP